MRDIDVRKIEKTGVHPLDEVFLRTLPPSPDFDFDHNKRVIEQTIKDTQAMIRQKGRESKEGINERAWAASHYLRNIQQGKGTRNVEQYFGKNFLLYLKGKDILNQIKEQLTANGNTSRNQDETFRGAVK